MREVVRVLAGRADVLVAAPMVRRWECEYRCTSCGVRVGTTHPATLYCIACKRLMLRWQ